VIDSVDVSSVVAVDDIGDDESKEEYSSEVIEVLVNDSVVLIIIVSSLVDEVWLYSEVES
jgi:hypothetical protein